MLVSFRREQILIFEPHISDTYILDKVSLQTLYDCSPKKKRKKVKKTKNNKQSTCAHNPVYGQSQWP